MNPRKILMVLACALALRAEGGMVRITGVENGRTLLAGTERVELAGVAVTDERAAKTMLEWTVVGRWVLLEKSGTAHFVYRSPDALFVNRELVLRGFARATLQEVDPPSTLAVTYLGTIDPIDPAPPAAAAAPPPAKTARGSGSGSGSSRHSSGERRSSRRRR
jgi:hypothetical protein